MAFILVLVVLQTETGSMISAFNLLTGLMLLRKGSDMDYEKATMVEMIWDISKILERIKQM